MCTALRRARIGNSKPQPAPRRTTGSFLLHPSPVTEQEIASSAVTQRITMFIDMRRIIAQLVAVLAFLVNMGWKGDRTGTLLN